MKKIKKYLNKIRLAIVKYIYTNRLFLTYFLLATLGTIIVRWATIGNLTAFKPLLVDMGLIILIGAFGYIIKPHNQFKYFFTWLIVFTVFEVVNSIYFIFYEGFASFSQLSTLSQTETVVDSIFVKLRVIDFVYILQPVLFYYIHNKLKKSSYYNILDKVEKKKTNFTISLIVSLALIIYSFATATRVDYSRLAKNWNSSYIVERFGIILYQFQDMYQTIMPRINSLFGEEEARALVDNYFNDEETLKYNYKNKYTNILNGYNIVYIHMESMQNFLMDLEFNGEKVTPNLNALAKEGMFFSNFYPQISIGTSSDAEYIMLTGLLPSTRGTVFVNHSHNTFNTLATQLKSLGYYTFSMHGNSAVMWNRKNIHHNLGYTDMYYRESFTFEDYKGSPDVVGLGINDELFFAQAVEKLENIEKTNKNYFGTLITLSNHSPFTKNDKFTLDIADYYTDPITNEQVSSCYLCERDIGKYLMSANYADKALGEFIELIKNSDAFQNTVFVFYGDHDAKMSYKDMIYLYNYDYLTGELKEPTDPTYRNYDSYDHNLNKKTPLILWTKNENLKKKLKGEVKTIMGMYDAAPTLYNMLGIDNKYVLGHDIFNIKNDNIVVFPNGNFLTNLVYRNNSTGDYKILKEGTILEDGYIEDRIAYTEMALEIGNTIINYDYFNPKKESDK